MITAEGEQKASRALREAAEVIAESTSALQVSSHLVILLIISTVKRLSNIIRRSHPPEYFSINQNIFFSLLISCPLKDKIDPPHNNEHPNGVMVSIFWHWFG